MQASGDRRIVVVSAAPIGTVPSPERPSAQARSGDGFFMRHLANPMVKAALRDHYADLPRWRRSCATAGLTGPSYGRRD